MSYYDGLRLSGLRQLSGGMIRSAKTGEFLVFEFTGPGTVQTQSRNPSALISWLTSTLPFQRG